MDTTNKTAGRMQRRKNPEQAFTVGENGSEGWILESVASSHMCPFQDEYVEIR